MKEKILKLFIIIIIILSPIFSITNLKYFNYLESILWSIVTVLLIVISLYFTYKLKFLQFNIKKIIKSLFQKNNSTISSLETLSISLAAKVGVGSLSGVALSILIGGPGSIFWMWIITLLTSIISYIEGYLGIKYQTNINGELIGGPSFYLKKVSNSKFIPIIYSILIIISYIFGFITIQANTIVKSINYVFNINKYILLFIIILLAGLTIFKGIKKVASFSLKIVPLMGIIYITLGIYVIIKNYYMLPQALIDIITSAFNFNSFLSGFLPTFIIGIQRGIFATEIGLGTNAISSSLTNDTKENQGYINLFGTYFTSFIICTITAFIILTSKININNYMHINGIEYVIDAFIYHLHNYGLIIFLLITILFAFSTIVSGYCFGELSFKYLFTKINKKDIIIFRIITLILIFLGGIISTNILWNIIDILISLLTIINLYGIIKLKNKIN